MTDRHRASSPSSRVAIVSSSWHHEIVHLAHSAILAEFSVQGLSADRVDQFEVPGAFEIPLFAKRLALTGHYEAIIACWLVVNGGIYRHELVAAAVIEGLMRVQIDTGIPIC